MQPMRMAALLEQRRETEPGHGDRFSGYGVPGVAFESGHVLAFQRYAASSIGPPFVTVWERDPLGRWILHTNVDASRSSARYFAPLLHDVRSDDIEIRWTGGAELCISARRARLQLALRLSASAATRVLGAGARMLPRAVWSSPRVSAPLAAGAARTLRARAMTCHGVTPSGHVYTLRPRALWRVDAAAAVLAGRDGGRMVPLDARVALGDLEIPRTGLLVAGSATFTAAHAADVHTTPSRDVLLARVLRSGTAQGGTDLRAD